MAKAVKKDILVKYVIDSREKDTSYTKDLVDQRISKDGIKFIEIETKAVKPNGCKVSTGDITIEIKAKDDENLNETLERIFNNIENSAKGAESEEDFAGLFDDIDVNSNKLGATVAKRNEKLVKILDGIANIPLGNYKDNSIDATVS